MSRSEYSDDLDPLSLGQWRGQVASAIRGKRGQKLLVDLLHALDEMEIKELITNKLVASDGAVCALGCLGKKRQYDMTSLDPHNSYQVASVFDVAHQLVQEIVFINDESYCSSPAARWKEVRQWVASQIKRPTTM